MGSWPGISTILCLIWRPRTFIPSVVDWTQLLLIVAHILEANGLSTLFTVRQGLHVLLVGLLRLLTLLPTLEFSVDDRDHVDGQHDRRHGDVNDSLASACASCKVNAEIAVDHANWNDEATEPEMGVRPKSPSAVLHEHSVVYEAEDRLDDEGNEKSDTNSGMGLAHHVLDSGDVYAHCEGDAVE